MAEPEGGKMSRHAFQVAYHGPDKDDHSMDVEALAPALLAFGKLIRETNAQINGDRATVKVLVTSDFEHKCFNINFEILQTIMQAIKSLLQDENIETATELLKTIGIIGTATGTLGGGLFGFLRWKKGRKIKKIQKTKDTDSSGVVIVHIEGDHNTVQVTNNVLKLSENKKILETIDKTLTPIETKDADRIEFRDHDKPVASFDRDDVKAIVSSCRLGQDEIAIDESIEKPEIVVGVLHSYSPVYDLKAPLWRFIYKKKPIYADISATTIAKDALRRGGSFVNDRYRVRMEVTPAKTDGGDPHHKILEVLDFTPSPQQVPLALPKPKRKTRKRG